MELVGDRIEIALRLLHNGRYVWTITTNTDATGGIARLKQLDGELRDTFPNHVKESSIRFSDVSTEEGE